MSCDLPVRATKCATCPFNPKAPPHLRAVAGTVAASALSSASRICHNTGSNNAVHRRTGKPEALCRGARDLQLHFFHALGFLSAPTDEAWNEARQRSNLKPQPTIEP